MESTLGKNIKIARLAANMTQEQVGQAIGVTGVTIMRYEKGTREPSFEQIEKIAKVLNYPLWRLIPAFSYGDVEEKLKKRERDPSSLSEMDLRILNEWDSMVADQNEQLRFASSRNNTGSSSFRVLIRAFEGLNEEGQKRAAEYLQELNQIPAYQKEKAESGGE